MTRGGSVSREPARIHGSSVSGLALGRDAHAKTSGHSRPSWGHRHGPRGGARGPENMACLPDSPLGTRGSAHTRVMAVPSRGGH